MVGFISSGSSFCSFTFESREFSSVLALFQIGGMKGLLKWSYHYRIELVDKMVSQLVEKKQPNAIPATSQPTLVPPHQFFGHPIFKSS
jgi:hypothetical protein